MTIILVPSQARPVQPHDSAIVDPDDQAKGGVGQACRSSIVIPMDVIAIGDGSSRHLGAVQWLIEHAVLNGLIGSYQAHGSDALFAIRWSSEVKFQTFDESFRIGGYVRGIVAVPGR